MSQKRIRRVYVENGCLEIASYFSDETCPQIFDPDNKHHDLHLLAKQINVMLEEAEIRGVKRGAEQGAEECLRLVIKTIKDLGEFR